MAEILAEELALMDYLKIDHNKVIVTGKGKVKFRNFIQSLTDEEKEALKLG
jgi:hypothetical protein